MTTALIVDDQTLQRPGFRMLLEAQPSRVLVLTTFDLDEYAYDALRAGDSVISPGLTRKLIDAFTTRIPGQGGGQDKRLAELTERDRVQAVIFAYDAGPVRPV